MKTAISLSLLLVLAFTLTDGRWCVGWGRNGGKTTQRLPCHYIAFDTNKDGKITKTEFQKVVATYGREGTAVVFSILDTNDDDVIEEKEFYQNAKRLVKIHLMASCQEGRARKWGWNWGWSSSKIMQSAASLQEEIVKNEATNSENI
ncbi:uncharacterized protein LOC134253737 isoform X1 [Saccostrea cucullata]|uniref:uncharacterized protein LOC134253737 isoform X1 n=1 Tax=Saccostrea cuccullata TaxID=36930 RepID=UPI002ED4102A